MYVYYVCMYVCKIHKGAPVLLCRSQCLPHSASTVDVGVQCRLIPILMTATPKHNGESEEEGEINLPQHQMQDNLSASWGEVTEEVREDNDDDRM